MLYPNGDANFDVCEEGTINVPVAANNANAIANALDDTEPGGGTPTAPTLVEGISALDSLGADGGARVMVLATDGGPNCNDSLNGNTCTCVTGNQADCQNGGQGNCLDNVNAGNAAQAANDAGFPVFVVGIPGSENFAFVLNDLANKGGTAQAGGTAYYQATDAQALSDALGDIATRVGVCRLDLPQNATPDQIEVAVGGGTIARDVTRQNGWDLVDPNTVELFGVACANAASGGAVVTLTVCVDGG
jgi:hypothetical protein